MLCKNSELYQRKALQTPAEDFGGDNDNNNIVVVVVIVVRIQFIYSSICIASEATKVYSTLYSQAVTHPSTNRARRCLTSVIGRELVLSTTVTLHTQVHLALCQYTHIVAWLWVEHWAD